MYLHGQNIYFKRRPKKYPCKIWLDVNTNIILATIFLVSIQTTFPLVTNTYSFYSILHILLCTQHFYLT